MAFERLPPELQTIVMGNMPDVKSLSSIVHASPIYHQTYLSAREEILHDTTVRILHEHNVSTLDAWTAVNVPQIGMGFVDRKGMTIDFLERYGDGMTDGRQRFTVKDSLAILSLQKKMVVLVEAYCNKVLSQNPNSNPSPRKEHERREASQFELRRLYRAFYRYEIWSRIFSANETLTDSPQRGRSSHFVFDEGYAATVYLGLFPIHEVEELACLHNYAKNFYIEWDDEGLRTSQLESLIARGPSLLHRALMKQTTPVRERSCDESRFHEPEVEMRAALDAYERILDTGEWSWRGLDEPVNSERLPTAGWEWASKRGVQNVDFKLRRWGYVFWDQKRLEDWDIMAEMMLNWIWLRPFAPNRRRVMSEAANLA